MPNIVPNSTVRLLTNCPLDKTYDHTIFFATRSAQTSYFEGLVKSPASTYTFTDVSYTRKDRGLKLQAPVGANLYDCNYMMFKNTAFENKWFYAFVTKVEYINNITWEIEFELDDMQTWFFDYELERCFIEREHSATDEIGDNLVPENLELGDYVSEGVSKCITGDDTSLTDSILDQQTIVFACTFDDNYADFTGSAYAGVYSGLYFKKFDIPVNASYSDWQTVASNINTWIAGAVSAVKLNGIIACFLMPTAMTTGVGSPSPSRQNQFHKTKNYTTLGGYAPKNKKLFTYPYNFLYCTNFQGQSAIFCYEYFNHEDYPNRCPFILTGNFAPDPSVVLVPRDYKGSSANWDEKMVLTGYPILPWSSDVYQAWVANGQGQTLISAFGSIGSYALQGGIMGAIGGGGAGAVPGSIVGAGIGIATTVASYLEQRRVKDAQPPQAHTGAGSSAMASVHLLDFGFMKKHIRPEFARIIDDYFNMYGYATHRCKVPNRNVRPHWTYTKTVGCCVKGTIPADSMAHICKIYDTGITFWKNGSEVGRYDLDNRPT